MTSVPGNINSVGGNFRAIAPGAGYGGDNGEGFHSTQPISLERNDDTENLHNRDRLQEGDGLSGDAIATFPKYLESPFTRYVSRPLSSGTLSDSVRNFVPEDRSKMGTPLNPFWIRNDLWSVANEADIFLDASPNWVAPRLNVSGTQTKQGFKRETYIDNEAQPQKSSAPAPIAPEYTEPPKESAAGNVTGTAEAAPVDTNKEMKDANPAKVKTQEEAPPKEGEMNQKTEETPQTASEEKPPPKKRSRKAK